MTFAVFHYLVVMACSEYHVGIQNGSTLTGTPASITSNMRGGLLSSASGYPIKQSSFRPHAQCFAPMRLAEHVKFIPSTHPAVEVPSTPIDMLHSPSGFPFWVSRRAIVCGFTPLDTFDYRLLKAESTQSHERFVNRSYGRTVLIDWPDCVNDVF